MVPKKKNGFTINIFKLLPRTVPKLFNHLKLFLSYTSYEMVKLNANIVKNTGLNSVSGPKWSKNKVRLMVNFNRPPVWSWMSLPSIQYVIVCIVIIPF